MILNETQPKSTARAWCLPFAGLALGLLATPVAATAQETAPQEPVRIEIRVNGKKVDGLSKAQRAALLELVGDREAKAQDPLRARGKGKKKSAGMPELEGLPNKAELRAMITQGLDEARREIAADDDLKELGITDEVLGMIDGLARGEGIESSLDEVVKAAMRGASKMARKELADDPDLKKLGLTDGIGKLVEGFLGSERNQELIADFARNAIDGAVKDVKRDLRSDRDLQRLGITADVERLIDAVLEGSPEGGLENQIEALVEKAAGAALREAEGEMGRELGRDPRPARKQRVDRAGLDDLQKELERARQELDRVREQLREMQQAAGRARRIR